jgi:hypothetical protein
LSVRDSNFKEMPILLHARFWRFQRASFDSLNLSTSANSYDAEEETMKSLRMPTVRSELLCLLRMPWVLERKREERFAGF